MDDALKDIVREAALKNGFFAVGVSAAEPLSELEHLDKWLANGLCASMDWIRRSPEARCDPSSLLPGAKSVICAALEYKLGRGRDYHDLVRGKLGILTDVIKKRHPSARFKTCVDTSPILEKALAVKAGIGWQGKHSVVINSDHGSFFVLGEIITDLEIEPDKPSSNQCGGCKKCIGACPTGAILEPYIIDARRCLSYLTIEHKGPIDDKLTKYIKPEQYGCDLCQKACPYNKGDSHDT